MSSSYTVDEEGFVILKIGNERPSVQFERCLSFLGYKLENGDLKCDHDTSPRYIWYVQECTCCSYHYYKEQHALTTIQSSSFPWNKYTGCEKCVDYHIGEIFCGGHYSNFRIYKSIGETEEGCGPEFNLGQHKLDPCEYVYEEEDDE